MQILSTEIDDDTNIDSNDDVSNTDDSNECGDIPIVIDNLNNDDDTSDIDDGNVDDGEPLPSLISSSDDNFDDVDRLIRLCLIMMCLPKIHPMIFLPCLVMPQTPVHLRVIFIANHVVDNTVINKSLH